MQCRSFLSLSTAARGSAKDRALRKSGRSCAPRRNPGKACRVMMLPLSTIEGKDTPTEEVKTKPPEKGALPSEKPEKAPRKPTRMKGTVSFKLLPICPMIPWASSEPALPGLPEQGLSKPTGSCPAAQREPGSRGKACRVMMLPLSTIEGKDTPTEEVKTKPPEKGVLFFENHDKAPRKPPRMKGTMSFRFLPFCTVLPWESSEAAVGGGPEQTLSKRIRSCPAAWREPGSGGKACRVMMLPLSTIEGKDTPTEEVKTKPPEKGALLSATPEEPPKKPPRMKGRMSFRVLPICPMPSVCFTYSVEQDDSDLDAQAPPEPSKPDSNCTFIPLPVLEFREVKVWECPLCCLSFVSAS
uniref:Uncharacterized protein n=1 Tax=Sus scrofa TaxID=9823 RepID=A0A8D2BU95_PIG